MRILFLNHNVAWRGTFFRCLSYARQLVRCGHEVVLVTIDPQARFRFQRETRDGVEIVLTPDLTWGMARSGWDPYDTMRRLLFLRHQRFDLVHAFDSRPSVIIPALVVRKRLRIPLVIDWADWWGRGGIIAERRSFLLRTGFAPIETWFEEAFRSHADFLTVISSALAERAKGLGIPADRIQRLPGGVDLEVWRPVSMRTARERLGLPGTKPIVLYAGFVRFDIDLVLRTFAEVRRHQPHAQLLLTGANHDLLRETRALGIEGAVLNRGTLSFDDVPWYVAAADVCLLPFADKIANRGRWPNKAGDYLAMGRPVVTNPVGDVGRFFSETGAGLLARPDATAMADAVIGILQSPDLAAALSQKARQAAEERLSYQKLVQPLENLYRTLIDGHTSAKSSQLAACSP